MKPLYLKQADLMRDRWMVSYVDVLTILLIFFIGGAAMSLQKRETAAPIAPPPPAPVAQKVVEEPRNPLKDLREKLADTGLDMTLEARGLVIRLPQAIVFASGDDRISPAAYPVIEQVAGVLSEIPNRVTLVGHADAKPIHNQRFHSNWELAAARGLRLMELMTAKFGLPEERLSVASYSSWAPNDSNDSEDGRARNRRAEIVISGDTPAPLTAGVISK